MKFEVFFSLIYWPKLYKLFFITEVWNDLYIILMPVTKSPVLLDYLFLRWFLKTLIKVTISHDTKSQEVSRLIDCLKISTLFYRRVESTWLNSAHGPLSKSRGLAERGQEEEYENEQHKGYTLCLGYLATFD